jgi:hypothetical protein
LSALRHFDGGAQTGANTIAAPVARRLIDPGRLIGVELADRPRGANLGRGAVVAARYGAFTEIYFRRPHQTKPFKKLRKSSSTLASSPSASMHSFNLRLIREMLS